MLRFCRCRRRSGCSTPVRQGLLPTVDESGIGIRADLQATVLPIAGRVGVAGDAASVVLNVTVTEPETNGYVTVFPCDAPRPTASNLNFTVGQTIPNTVITKLAGDGTVCLFTFGRTHLVVDVAGAFASDAFLPLPAPQRIADTRAGYPTADGRFSGTGALTTGGTLAVEVGGRAGIPPGGSTVVLNVTVTEPESAGFVTVYPCNAPRPTASNLNFTPGQTIPTRWSPPSTRTARCASTHTPPRIS